MAKPQRRHLPRQRQSQSPPATIASRPEVGQGGTSITEPGSRAMKAAVSSTMPMP